MRRSTLRPLGAVALVTPFLAGVLQAPAAARAPAVTSRTVTVRVGDYFFRPARLVVHVGDRVRFVNVGRIEHTVADATPSWRIGGRRIHPRPLRRGAVQLVTLRRSGTLRYLCTFHPSLMRGVLIVRP